VFMLIGLQLPSIVRGLAARGTGDLIFLGVAISLTVIIARIVWVFPATYLPRRLSAKIRERDPEPPRGVVFVVAWAGMRGAVSLAAALALPITPTPFPERDLLIYLTFCVILATLVGQGLTLPWIIGRLGLVAGTGSEREEQRARQVAIDAALDRLNDLAVEYSDHLPLVDQLRARFEHEADHAWPDDGADLDEADHERIDHQAIRLSVVDAQRDAVIRLRDDGVIGDDALRRVERDLDLEALRSGV
jgi:monovalent cation/hydrogen antiporter